VSFESLVGSIMHGESAVEVTVTVNVTYLLAETSAGTSDATV
jgi:hypothetical protein